MKIREIAFHATYLDPVEAADCIGERPFEFGIKGTRFVVERGPDLIDDGTGEALPSFIARFEGCEDHFIFKDGRIGRSDEILADWRLLFPTLYHAVVACGRSIERN